MKFTAITDFNPGDTLECNGSQLPVLTAEGKTYTVPAWKAGDAVVLAFQRESARVLAPMANKLETGPLCDAQFSLLGGCNVHSGGAYLDGNGWVRIFMAVEKADGFAHGETFMVLSEGIGLRRKCLYPHIVRRATSGELSF